MVAIATEAFDFTTRSKIHAQHASKFAPQLPGQGSQLLEHCRAAAVRVTIHHVDLGVDTGDVAFQREVATDWLDTGKTLFSKAQDAMISLFQDVCPRIVNLDIPKIAQSLEQGSFHRRNELESASTIDLDRKYSARELLDILRARTFPPHPGAHFEDNGVFYEVHIAIQKRSRKLDATDEFEREKKRNIEALGADSEARRLSKEWFLRASELRYSYNFTWLGRPIIQFPQDLIALQEIIWAVKPDLIIETGIAHGGSLIFYASLLELIGLDGSVVGVDVDIRPHNRAALDDHPLRKRITLIEGDSCSSSVIAEIEKIAKAKTRTLIVLDSNHTTDHVARELELYERFVGMGSYLIVFDTIIDEMPEAFSLDRPWGPGNGPRGAVVNS